MKKKLLAALLVAILASSMVFAGFKGSAEAQFGWNIDDKSFGFDNLQDPSVTLTLATENGENKGEGDVYGEIKATLEVTLAKADVGKETADIKAELKDFEANVVGANWTVGLTGAMDAVDFASSYSLKSNGAPMWNYKLAPTKVAGVTVDVFGYGFGVGFNKDYAKYGEKANGAYFTAKTPEYKFLEDSLKVQAGATAAVQTKDFKKAQYGFGGKVAYALDPLSASVAADFGIAVANGEAKFDADVAANVSFSPVALDVYYATNVDPVEVKEGLEFPSVENLLNAKVTAKLDDFVGMPLSFYVNFINLVNDQRFLQANATATVIDALTLGLTYNTYLQRPFYWTLAADASYDFDVVAVSGGVEYDYFENTLALSAEVSSTKLISNATLSLSYTGLTFDFDENDDNKLGSVVASCKISF